MQAVSLLRMILCEASVGGLGFPMRKGGRGKGLASPGVLRQLHQGACDLHSREPTCADSKYNCNAPPESICNWLAAAGMGRSDLERCWPSCTWCLAGRGLQPSQAPRLTRPTYSKRGCDYAAVHMLVLSPAAKSYAPISPIQQSNTQAAGRPAARPLTSSPLGVLCQLVCHPPRDRPRPVLVLRRGKATAGC
jgi:hypothetical protein